MPFNVLASINEICKISDKLVPVIQGAISGARQLTPHADGFPDLDEAFLTTRRGTVSFMSVPASKAELLAAINVSFDKLMSDLVQIPEERTREISLQGHAARTMMSPADLVSYLLGWNELVLKWLDQDDQGAAVDFPETGFKWNQLGLLAQKFYADYRPLDWPTLIERLTTAKTRLVETIASRPNDELYGKPWYDKWPKGRMIQFNSSSPYANARGRIRKWLKSTT